MIRYGDLVAGFKKGVITLGEEPYGNATVCWIGDNWFHFTDSEYDYSPSEYMADYGYRLVAEHVYAALNDVGGFAGLQSSDPDEYAYYEAVLQEAGCMGHIA